MADVLGVICQMVEETPEVDPAHFEVEGRGLTLVVAGAPHLVLGTGLHCGDAVAASVDDDAGVDPDHPASPGYQGAHRDPVVDDHIDQLCHEPDVRSGFGDHLLDDHLADLEVLRPGIAGSPGLLTWLELPASGRSTPAGCRPPSVDPLRPPDGPLGSRPETDGAHHHRTAAMGTPQERKVLGEDGPCTVPRGSDSCHEPRRPASHNQHIR